MSRDEPTNFLYPFIDAEEDNAASLLADLAASAQAKAAESLALRRSTLQVNADLLEPGRHRDGTPLSGGWALVHLRKRRQLHRFHHFGGFVRPAADRQAAAGLVADRRSGDRDRAGQ